MYRLPSNKYLCFYKLGIDYGLFVGLTIMVWGYKYMFNTKWTTDDAIFFFKKCWQEDFLFGRGSSTSGLSGLLNDILLVIISIILFKINIFWGLISFAITFCCCYYYYDIQRYKNEYLLQTHRKKMLWSIGSWGFYILLVFVAKKLYVYAEL